jgi:hypothetical protein
MSELAATLVKNALLNSPFMTPRDTEVAPEPAPAPALVDNATEALLILAIVRKIHPLLNSHHIVVDCNRNFDFFFRVYESVGALRLDFGITPNHPEFRSIIRDAALACYQVATKINMAKRLEEHARA